MKKFNRQEFKDKVIGYYGCKKKKPLSGQKSKVSRQHFDDGITTAFSYSRSTHGEYDAYAKKNGCKEYDIAPNGWLTEYEVVSSGTKKVSSQQSFSDGFFVEPFEDSPAIVGKQPANVAEKKENCQCQQPAQQPAGNNAATAVAEEAKKLREDALQNVPSPEIPTVSFGKGAKVTDDDFLADMKAILSGSKTYDAAAKKAVDKNVAKSRQSQQQSQAPKEEEIKPLESKNEHQIFDKIAQSMKYANAYDLGSFAIEQRFDDFDKLDEIKTKTKKKKNTTSPVSYSASRTETDKVTNEDFVNDMDLIVQQSKSEKETAKKEKKEEKIPLDPGVGGLCIGISALQPGDIIISTTDADISKKIRQATGSEVSHSAMYIGDGNVIESVDSGVLQFSVETSIEHDSVAVAYRHRDMTPEKAATVVAFLKKAKKDGRKFDYMGLIRVAPYQVISSYCDSVPEALRGACRAGAANFKLGTDNNNEFYCSELVFEALKQAGLSMSDVDPSWSSPQDVVRLNHNGTLHYVGHLKP